MMCIKINGFSNKGHVLTYMSALWLITILAIGYLISSDPELLKQSVNVAPTTPEVHHIVFLKVHKAASSTMMNIFMKYGVSHNLRIMVPRKLNTFSQHTHLHKGQVLQYSPTGKYDILCCHVIYNKSAMAPFFPSDTRYIGIVREPFKQFLSAFNYYYHLPYLKNIPGDNPLSTYLKDPGKFEPELLMSSFTNNRMSLDFGYPVNEFTNINYMKDHLKQLEAELNFVIIVEYFDESLLMMKRLLGWSLQDILYVPKKNFKKKFEKFTEEDKVLHREWAQLDYILYERFLDIFLKRLDQQPESFHDELIVFRKVNQEVQEFCSSSNKGYYRVQETPYNEASFVTRLDCSFMKLDGGQLVDAVRDRYKN